ncbi:MAG: hypothetical protein ACJA2P_001968 [Rhodoferax sp.]|jgi:hypothetical protein
MFIGTYLVIFSVFAPVEPKEQVHDISDATLWPKRWSRVWHKAVRQPRTERSIQRLAPVKVLSVCPMACNHKQLTVIKSPPLATHATRKVHQLSKALNHMRDVLMKVSLELRDIQCERDMAQRQEAMKRISNCVDKVK